jgi:hypothetical protein
MQKRVTVNMLYSFVYLFIGLFSLGIIGLFLAETPRSKTLSIFYINSSLLCFFYYISSIFQSGEVLVLGLISTMISLLVMYRRAEE